MEIEKDGNMYCVHSDKFTNLQESDEFSYPVNDSAFICPYPQKRCHECMRCWDNPPKYIAFKKH